MTVQRLTDRGYHADMDKPRYVLRNLPGIKEVEALLARIQAHPNPAWAPERDALDDLVERVSLTLFGMGQDDYLPRSEEAPEGATQEEFLAWATRWNEHFAFLDYYPDDDEDEEAADRAERLIWNAMGWDVTDGHGGLLPCLGYFERQIVCTTKGLRGRLPGTPMSEDEARDEAEAWGERLLQGYRKGPRRRE